MYGKSENSVIANGNGMIDIRLSNHRFSEVMFKELASKEKIDVRKLKRRLDELGVAHYI